MGEKTTIRRAYQLTCQDILEATGGHLLTGHRETPFLGVATDSRTLKRDEVFVALTGEHFDGHDFVRDALDKGAAGAIVENTHLQGGLREPFQTRTVIAVPETLRALGDVARFWRQRFSLPVIAITGSNGKTTTKEIIGFLLEERFSVLKSPGSFNNLVGLPLTLLDLKPSHEVAIVEMGTNMPGEIGRLAEIAHPTVGIITNISEAHIEGMRSLEVLAREKGELFRAMGEDDVIAVNQNDPRVLALAGDCRAKKIGFGINTGADVTIDRVQWRGARGVRFRLSMGKERAWIDLPVVGIQLVHNMVAAVAVASIFAMNMVDIRRRLEQFGPLPMRMEPIQLRDATFINDAYNANPTSVEMALKTLSHTREKRRSLVVLGDMLELGDLSRTAHRKVGRLIGELNVAGLFLLGDYANEVAGGAVEEGMNPHRIWIGKNHREIVNLLKNEVRPGDWILVKGSRRMQMERVIEILKEEA